MAPRFNPRHPTFLTGQPSRSLKAKHWPFLRPALFCVSVSPPFSHTRRGGRCRNTENTPEPGHQGSPLSHPGRDNKALKNTRGRLQAQRGGQQHPAEAAWDGNHQADAVNSGNITAIVWRFRAVTSRPNIQEAQIKQQECGTSRCALASVFAIFLPPWLLHPSSALLRPDPVARGSSAWRSRVTLGSPTITRGWLKRPPARNSHVEMDARMCLSQRKTSSFCFLWLCTTFKWWDFCLVRNKVTVAFLLSFTTYWPCCLDWTHRTTIWMSWKAYSYQRSNNLLLTTEKQHFYYISHFLRGRDRLISFLESYGNK